MVRVLLKSPDKRLGDCNEIDVEEDMTVGEVRIVVSTLPCLEQLGVPVSALRLIYRGRALVNDDEPLRDVFAGADLTQPVTMHAVIAHFENEPRPAAQAAEPGPAGDAPHDNNQPVIEFRWATLLAAVFVAVMITNFFRREGTVLVCLLITVGYLWSIGVVSWIFRKFFPAMPPPPPDQQNRDAPHPPRPLHVKILIACAAFFASFIPTFNAREFVQHFE